MTLLPLSSINQLEPCDFAIDRVRMRVHWLLLHITNIILQANIHFSDMRIATALIEKRNIMQLQWLVKPVHNNLLPCLKDLTTMKMPHSKICHFSAHAPRFGVVHAIN